MDDVVKVLEDEGVDKFVVAWEQLLGAVTSALADARVAAGR
jgi:transaldolase